MPPEIKPLPPDHPIFSLGVGFVFRSELPSDDEGLPPQAVWFLDRLRESKARAEREHDEDVDE